MQNQIQTLSFDTLPVQFSSDAFLNATVVAKHFNKVPKDYLKTEQTQDYIAALAESLSKGRKIPLNNNQLVTVKNGAPETGGGTWLHPKLAIHFARWLNPKFAVWCDEQIENLLSGNLPKQIAPKKSKTVAGGLTLEQVEQVQAMHKMLVGSVEKERQGALAVTLWSAIKAKFGCNYKEIPPEYFLDVLSLMSRTAADKNAQWQEQTSPPLNRKVFEQIAKVCAYANRWGDMQKLLCGKPDSPESKRLLNMAIHSANLNHTGFLFVFCPDVENDVKFVADWLREQSAYI